MCDGADDVDAVGKADGQGAFGLRGGGWHETAPGAIAAFAVKPVAGFEVLLGDGHHIAAPFSR
jgi:hypothetical protein